MADHIRERMKCLEILGLQPTATEDEIKKAYKTGALKYHPDKNKSEGATEQFQEIQYAYKYLQEGPEILDHHSEDDDDGIPIFFLMRLFPWLFQSYSGAGMRPTHSRFFMYNNYDTSSDEEYDTPDDEYRASSYKATTDVSSSQNSTSAKSRKSESKRQKKKRAKQKRREEKSAAAKTQREKVQTSSDSSCRENPVTLAAQTDQLKGDNSENPDSGRQSCPSSNKDNPVSADSTSGQVPLAEEGVSGQPSIVSDDSQADTNTKASKSSTKNTGAGQPQPLQPPHLPPKKSKQQIREEQRKREEEANKIRKELEENLRLEQERKARKQAAREEKERLEAERRKQQEEEEIAAEAQRLIMEEKRQAEEKAKKQKEEEEERERQRLLAELDSNMFMDASGDFLTRDSEGVGNIKKRTVVYTSPEYDSLWEQRSERSVFAGPSSHNQPYGQSSFNQPNRAFRGDGGYRGGRDFRFPRSGPARGFQPRPPFQTGNYLTRMEPSSQSWEEQMQMNERWEEQHQARKISQPADDQRSHSDNHELFTTASARDPPESPLQTFHKRTDAPMQGYGRVNQPTDPVPFRLNDSSEPQPTFGGGLNGPPGKHGGVPSAQALNNAGSMQQPGAVNQSNGPHSAGKVVHNGVASDSLRGRGRENVGLNVAQKNNLLHGGDDKMHMEGKHNNLHRPTSGDVKASLPEKGDHGELASIFNGSRLEKVVERSSSISSDGSDFHQLPSKPHFSVGMHPPPNRPAMHSAASGAPPLLPFPTPGLPPGFNQQNIPAFSPFVHQPFFTQRPATPQPFVSQPAVAQRPPSFSQTRLAAPSFVNMPQTGGPFQPVPPGPQFVSPSQKASQWTMHRPAQGQVPQRGSVPPFDSKPQPATSLHQAYKGSGGNVSDVFSGSHGLDDIDD